jgi:hypothetical protein
VSGAPPAAEGLAGMSQLHALIAQFGPAQHANLDPGRRRRAASPAAGIALIIAVATAFAGSRWQPG